MKNYSKRLTKGMIIALLVSGVITFTIIMMIVVPIIGYSYLTFKIAGILLLITQLPLAIKVIKEILLAYVREDTNNSRKIKTQEEKRLLDEYYNKHVKSSYIEVRNIFKSSMQQRKLKRQHILKFKCLLDGCLRQYGKLKTYKYYNFKSNDAYEIYTKLKDKQLDVEDFDLLKKYLSKVSLENEKLLDNQS